jgi:acetyltransferase-like isoleucine patch superfamily enzyme
VKHILKKCKAVYAALIYYIYNEIISHVPLYCARNWYLRRILRIGVGEKTAIHMGCFISGNNIRIGSNSVVNRNTYLDGRTSLTIGDNVSISPHVYIISLDHDPQSPSFAAIGKPVVIDDYVWIGARAILLPGVHLGKGCIVGAGAVVSRDIPAYSIAVGIPAKVVGQRTHDLNYTPAYFPYFNTDIT